jgi:hypothetical protein
MTTKKVSKQIGVTLEQKKEGYWLDLHRNNVIVWHKKSLIEVLEYSHDIDAKIKAVIERRKQELNKLKEKPGENPD